jgi:hypothetical protein
VAFCGSRIFWQLAGQLRGILKNVYDFTQYLGGSPGEVTVALKIIAVLVLCQIVLVQGYPAFAEDYSECMMRCDTEYADCTNEPQAPEPEVQAAKISACEQRVVICHADCENLKPIEPPTGTEDNPNIIRK